MAAAVCPSALDRWDEIQGLLEDRRLALFLDYDGTLAPIAPRPELAILPEATRDVLRRLAALFPLAVLSGRGREDVAALVGLDGVVYAGAHGFDIAGPALRHEVGEGVPQLVEQAATALRQRLAGLPGILVEPKRFAVAVHFRMARDVDLPHIEAAVDAVLAELSGLRKTVGKKVFELRPELDWGKGRALRWILEAQGLDDRETLPLFVGDDLTDEDAFRAVEPTGLGIRVAGEPHPTAACYSLHDSEEVRQFLERIAELGDGQTAMI